MDGSEIKTNDKVFAVLLMACGFLFIDFVILGGGIGITIFAIVICTVSGVYLKSKGFGQNKRSLTALAVIALLSVSFTLFQLFDIGMLILLGLCMVYLYWIALTAGATLDSKLSVYVMGDAVRQVLTVPFSNFIALFKVLAAKTGEKKKGSSFIAALMGIAIALIVLMAVVPLLMSADSGFAYIIQIWAKDLISGDVVFYVIEAIVGVPVAMYLCGIIRGNMYRRDRGELATKEAFDKTKSQLQIAPGVTIYTAMTIVNIVYLVFFIAQASYLFSSFENIIPSGMTYADYARKGFFELSAVAAINLAVIGLSTVFIKRKEDGGAVPTAMKIETTVMSVFTLMMTVIGLSKMFMYIDAYGLTRMRIYTSLFMAMLFIFFMIIIARQWCTFNSTRIIIAVGVLTLLVTAYSNVDSRIAEYNIDRYKDGSLNVSGMEYVLTLSDGAYPHIYDWYKTTEDSEIKERLYMYLSGKDEYGFPIDNIDRRWQEFNLQTWQKNRIQSEI